MTVELLPEPQPAFHKIIGTINKRTKRLFIIVILVAELSHVEFVLWKARLANSIAAKLLRTLRSWQSFFSELEFSQFVGMPSQLPAPK